MPQMFPAPVLTLAMIVSILCLFSMVRVSWYYNSDSPLFFCSKSEKDASLLKFNQIW